MHLDNKKEIKMARKVYCYSNRSLLNLDVIIFQINLVICLETRKSRRCGFLFSYGKNSFRNFLSLFPVCSGKIVFQTLSV